MTPTSNGDVTRSSSGASSPFLITFAERTAELELEGAFDDATDVWRVRVGGRPEPLILQSGTIVGTQTVTRVLNEGTDED